MTKTVKRLSVILFAGLAGICAFFALLTFRPLTQAKAETLITVTVYDGNNLNEIDSKQVDVSDGAKQFPKALVNSITAYFGEETVKLYGGNIYGASIVSTNTETNESVTSWGGITEVWALSISKDNIEVYIYTKNDVKIKLFYENAEKGTLTVPYYKKVKEVTYKDLNAISDVKRDGYGVSSFDPISINLTFPEAGVRSLRLIYSKTYPITFMDETGSKVLCVRELISGTYFDSRTDSELQVAAKKDGYLLSGWRTANVDKGYLAFNVPAEAMTFYAMYKENSENLVTITFTNGEETLYSTKVKAGTTPKLSDFPDLSEKAKKAGFVFKGWKNVNGDIFGIDSEILDTVYLDTTYTAVYEATGITRYVVYFYVDGLERASHTAKLSVDIIFSDYADVLALQEKDGYTFKGWQKKGDEDGELLTDKYAYQIGDEESDVILEAVFEKQSFFEKSFGKLGISTGGLVLCGIAVYLLFFRRTRRR